MENTPLSLLGTTMPIDTVFIILLTSYVLSKFTVHHAILLFMS